MAIEIFVCHFLYRHETLTDNKIKNCCFCIFQNQSGSISDTEADTFHLLTFKQLIVGDKIIFLSVGINLV